jgi:L-iditol 2-dehydrogenase
MQIKKKHVEIRGGWGSDYSHFHRAVKVLAAQGGALPWTDAISSHYSLDTVGDALAAVERRAVVKAIVEP